MSKLENAYMRVLKDQVELLEKTRTVIVDKLAQCELQDLKVKKRGGRGNGLKLNSDNDRSMYMWIETNYKGKEYDINLFKSEIDYKSGNCHSQIGRIMFTKGYIRNLSDVTSTNRILQDFKGRYQTNERSTVLVFNSENWIDPLSYFSNKDKGRLVNGHWISVDDILQNESIGDELISAFITFIKKESELF